MWSVLYRYKVGNGIRALTVDLHANIAIPYTNNWTSSVDTLRRTTNHLPCTRMQQHCHRTIHNNTANERRRSGLRNLPGKMSGLGRWNTIIECKGIRGAINSSRQNVGEIDHECSGVDFDTYQHYPGHITGTHRHTVCSVPHCRLPPKGKGTHAADWQYVTQMHQSLTSTTEPPLASGRKEPEPTKPLPAPLGKVPYTRCRTWDGNYK
jgi:hypothetical protein